MLSSFPGRCKATDAGGVRLQTGDRPPTRQGAGSEGGNGETERASMAQKNRQKSGNNGDTSFGPVVDVDAEGRCFFGPKARVGGWVLLIL